MYLSKIFKILPKKLKNEHLQYCATILSLLQSMKTQLNVYGYKPTLQVGEQQISVLEKYQFCDCHHDRKMIKVCTNFAKIIYQFNLVQSFIPLPF